MTKITMVVSCSTYMYFIILLTPSLFTTTTSQPPYNQWGLEKVALEGLKANTDLQYHGRVILDRALWIPYVPRKALDRASFPCHDACTYIFGRSKQAPLESSGLRRVTESDLLDLRGAMILLDRTKAVQPAKRKQKKRPKHA
jgi:hypothetical protein